MKWMIDRIEGQAQGEDHAFGISPAYDEITWEGLDFSREQFASVTDMNADDWKKELALHDEHFEKLAYHLPAALVETKARMEARILGQ
jgi:phosphoenolpyruvate carboxykinase (GTP)